MYLKHHETVQVEMVIARIKFSVLSQKLSIKFGQEIILAIFDKFIKKHIIS